jgi:NAD(P)-dependent dehydrogenase (short-subunit alcohol dehydrogenase family)
MCKLDCIVITGAGQGIGKAIALDLGRHKIHILCISKSNKCKETVVEIVKAGGSAESVIVDIGGIEKTKQLISAWIEGKSYKRTGLVLAAGILGPQDFQNLGGWEECYRVNVLGNLAVYSGLLPRMLENRFGRIVCFAGGGAAYAYPLFPAYAASKTAMVRTAENMQEDLNTKGDFAVVCLAPGANETNMLKNIRATGAKIRTVVDTKEPVCFVRKFLFCEDCGFKGSFVHVRDNWQDYLDSGKQTGDAKWKLRRIES